MTTTPHAQYADQAALPVIDISRLRAPDPWARRTVGEAMRAACLDKGFFYIANHGIPDTLQKAVFDTAQSFFEQPLAIKLAVDKARSRANRGYEPLRGQTLEPSAAPDLKEGFYIGKELAEDDPRVLAGKFNHGPNQWPDVPGFRTAMEDYYAAMLELSALIMQGLALSLELPEDYFADFCHDPLAILRLLHYPPQPAQAATDEKGCGAHTDFGGITLLLQDENGGLQVWDQRHEQWLQATPIPGTYVVNLGDMIARWTNNRYRSTLHRVINTSGRERYSVPFFYSGAPDHLVECIPNCLAPGESAHYPPTTVEQHMRDRYRLTYA
ncbi:oxidoreductase [Alkalilimnicola ehrlichii]|uniref:2-oxoglutarate-dependent ethylene/succinate-forming enzyme n=1 Tax=Alkalilimnicola ehrlichii TaxID=351052 RepID=A0A3E0X2A5_9GAMM|nr:2-oxoglutarate and iron-dependent oxygenase domain-containing protein [Alkalilimnicola ehrlichii]RFA28419.1 oxidoreductase [Alkalilimnicola ehrlichii]RFA38513.1 oxidoreductase [Alkalilimnicola ehrlichii]